ncbi:MAG: phosphatase PAP2 family protein [Candidatus Caenarcaniphilales bacterium]|nr:phosphatase PAP2 family protein [Candidatus Caenarcaniphilales bacterium]
MIISLISVGAATASYFFFDITIAKFWKLSINHGSFNVFIVRAFKLIGKIGEDHICLLMWLGFYSLLPIKNKFSKDKGLFLFLTYFVPFVSIYSLKFILGRARPSLYFSEGLYGFTFLEIFNASKHSMPSGHAGIISATMTSLALVFPRLAWLFYSISFVIAISRVITGAHYPSDIIIGWALGHLIVKALYDFRFKLAFVEDQPQITAKETEKSSELVGAKV